MFDKHEESVISRPIPSSGVTGCAWTVEKEEKREVRSDDVFDHQGN
jgi:hypothetical protein